LSDRAKIRRFEEIALRHLDAAYNLARWLTRNADDAEDVVQESFLRALKYFDGFRGEDGRSWLLTIVRHTCYTWLQTNRPKDTVPFREDLGYEEGEEDSAGRMGEAQASTDSPEALALQRADAELLNAAIGELPLEFREALVLRELEDLSYKEIAKVLEIPLGTVMSRLARARKLLQRSLVAHLAKESGT
jgi:RNA polymerase sigma-70 factor (ECF subfamily)